MSRLPDKFLAKFLKYRFKSIVLKDKQTVGQFFTKFNSSLLRVCN